MSLKGTALPLSKAKILETQKRYNIDLGREIEWQLVSVPLAEVLLNGFNNRFTPDEEMSEDEHEQAVVEEDARAFENLQKSMESNPQFEQLVGYTVDGEEGIRLIMGHRRYFALKRAGIGYALIWISHALTGDEVEHVRDWPEIHQTKVAHSTFARYKAIYVDLKGRNEIDREKRIGVWKQKGYTKAQIQKAERVFGRMESFCASEGEKPSRRISQVKAFETYDQICETVFQPLKDQGDVAKVVTLDKVAKAFLKAEIAHDDLKVTIDGLVELPASDPAIKAISSDPGYLSDLANLRRLTIIARANRNSDSVVEDVHDFTARVFSKLVHRADVAEISACLDEFKDTAARLESTLATIKAGGVQ